jgi:hypothetical protein
MLFSMLAAIVILTRRYFKAAADWFGWFSPSNGDGTIEIVALQQTAQQDPSRKNRFGLR